MGIKGCSPGTVIWSASNMTFKSIHNLNVGKRIDVDGNLLAWKLGMTKPISDVISLMASFLKTVANYGGFEITVIFDGDVRPDCKRASWSRRKHRELDSINKQYCRFKALEVGRKMSSSSLDAFEIKKYTHEFREFSKFAKSLETKSKRNIDIPPDMPQRLSERLMMIGACDKGPNGGYVVEHIIKAKFQADSVIAHRSVNGKSDFILSEDTDFFGLLGSKCILIKKITFPKSKNQINILNDTKFIIAGACNKRMVEFKHIIDSSTLLSIEDKAVEWLVAATPILSYSNPFLRGMVALTLGCDILLNGVRDIGIVKLQKEIDKYATEEEAFLGVKELMMQSMKVNEAIVETLLASFLYEPGVTVTDEVDIVDDEKESESIDTAQKQSSLYIIDAPTSLPTYLESYVIENENVEVNHSGPEICVCKGGINGSKPHKYLMFEGSYTCAVCNDVFCEMCVFIPEADKRDGPKQKNKKIYYEECNKITCLDCFRFHRTGTKETFTQTSDLISVEDMRKQLNKKCGLQLAYNPDMMIETVDLYDYYISAPDSAMNMISSRIQTHVKFPILHSNIINEYDAGKESSFRLLCSFDVREGGRFISDESLLSNDKVVDVMILLSSILEQRTDATVQQKNDIGEYHYLPTIFHNFAFYSRVDSGYRLLDRAARHACDPKTPSFLNAKCDFFEYEGTLNAIKTFISILVCSKLDSYVQTRQV